MNVDWQKAVIVFLCFSSAFFWSSAPREKKTRGLRYLEIRSIRKHFAKAMNSKNSFVDFLLEILDDS